MIDSVENENIAAYEINLTLPFIILENGDHPQRFLKYVRPFFNIINESVKAKKKKNPTPPTNEDVSDIALALVRANVLSRMYWQQ